MNRGRKIAALVCQNNNIDRNTSEKKSIQTNAVENWIDPGNDIEIDMSRLNGICIDEYTMVFDTFDELVENNIYYDVNNSGTEVNSMVDIRENNFVMSNQSEKNVTMNEENECPILMKNIPSERFEILVLLESNVDIQSDIECAYENKLNEELNEAHVDSNDGSRQVKYQSQKNRLFGKEYIGYKIVNGKSVQNVPKVKRTIKKRCSHIHLQKISSKSFMCGLFSENDRMHAFKSFWKMNTWQEKRGFVRGLVINCPITRRRKLNKLDINPKKTESRDIRLCLINGQKLKVCRTFF